MNKGQQKTTNLKSEHILLKNMLCSCCIQMLKNSLIQLGIEVLSIKLGEAQIAYDPKITTRKQIVEAVEKIGLELITDKNQAVVEEIKQTVIELIHYMNNVNSVVRKSEYLVEKMGKSYQTLSKLFSKYEPITLEKFILLQKIERVKELALDDKYTLSEIAWMMDYSSPHHLSNQFKQLVGVSLSDYKKNPAVYKKPINQIY
ncbi:MAG: helix-turn-helix domain-containing protein [Bacteroidales bacterium]|nr:helix-turn-helix domain-containing protein [Bacteroidales bacterium]